MPKRTLSAKLLLIVSLAVLAISGCSTIEKMQPIDIYMLNVPDGKAHCSNSESGPCPAKPISELDKAFVFEPKTWIIIQDYLDYLTCVAEGGCKSAELMSSRPIQLRGTDIRFFKARLQNVKKSLERQRR